MAEMRLASQDDVIRHLKLDAVTHADDIQHVIRIENALADVFEHRCGRIFDAATPMPITRRVLTHAGNLVTTPLPLHSIVSIDVVHELDPLVTEAVEPRTWFPWGTASDGGYVGIWFVDPVRSGHLLEITGTWADQDVDGVPADVKEAMTLLVIKTWRRYKSSPVDVVGGDAFTVPTPDGWNDSLVKNAIAHHRVNRRRVGV